MYSTFRLQITYTLKADLYHIAPLYVFTVLKRTPHSQGYMDISWLQRHRLVYMGFVHCGGTFQMPTHYGTKKVIWLELGIYVIFKYQLCVHYGI